ncbi:MAG TPA: trypsin-like peptidase domain-containing protein [Thermoanaerobaculia bacterium]|nr:trypsin-like peptidase domain-containing protein [Thermoanaerobaculia bacterium]
MRVLFSLALLLSSPLLATDVLAPLVVKSREVQVASVPPLRSSAMAAAVVLEAKGATASDVASLRAANAAGDGALQVGVVREVKPVAISSAAADEPFRWRGSVRVSGAQRVRVRLDGVVLPVGTKLWVYGATGAAVEVDRALVHGGVLWTPSVVGDAATIEIDAPESAAFRIGAIADVRTAAEVAPQATECIRDISCHQIEGSLSRGIAFYEYVGGTMVRACTGGLLNNVKEDGRPYFLTANHCVKTQEHAATVETFWDYRSSSCNGEAPALNTLPRGYGATLLATSQPSDVTLLRLAAIPDNRTFLGWDARAIAAGTTLFHISHPNAVAQRYSTSVVETSGSECAFAPRANHIYSNPETGATDRGSSGAPVLYGAGFVVGQLKGACGPEPENACNRENHEVDGAFATSYAVLRPYLDPAPVCETCTPGDTTACMLDGHFKVTVSWIDTYIQQQGPGRVIRYAENKPQMHPELGAIVEGSFFSFYSNQPNTVETMIKMIKGAGINGKYWIFVSGFTGSEYTVTVQDTRNCAKWERTMPRDSREMLRDYEAFSIP